MAVVAFVVMQINSCHSLCIGHSLPSAVGHCIQASRTLDAHGRRSRRRRRDWRREKSTIQIPRDCARTRSCGRARGPLKTAVMKTINILGSVCTSEREVRGKQRSRNNNSLPRPSSPSAFHPSPYGADGLLRGGD